MSGGYYSIATTRKSNKKAELLSLGEDLVIATEEGDMVARVMEITSSKGARVIFDPVAGAFLEKLAEPSTIGGIVFEYGWLAMQPTPLPLVTVLLQGLSIHGYSLMEVARNPEKVPAAKKYVYDQGWRMGDSIRRPQGYFRSRRP
ncbi:MAG: zinc-binding dehydrogenase [Candidatus Acidiferrales bacterium]